MPFFVSLKQEVAPWWDRYDSWFSFIIILLLVIGFATFVDSFSKSGLWTAFDEFIRHSGLLALLTAFTAIIALYRLRHRPDKTRPAVREDFETYNNDDPTDFGLRNYGPGPALYVQAVVTVEQDYEVSRFEVQDHPIHLQEDDFASLIPDGDDDWVVDMAQEYRMDSSNGDEAKDNSPMVNLYYSYVSQSGAREPFNISTKRDDTPLLDSDELTDPDEGPRQIELSKLVNGLRTSPSERGES